MSRFQLCFQLQRAPVHTGERDGARVRGGAVQAASIKIRVESAPGFSA